MFCPLDRRNRRSRKQLHRAESPLQAFGINHLPMDTAIRAKLRIFRISHWDGSTRTQELLRLRIRVSRKYTPKFQTESTRSKNHGSDSANSTAIF